MSLLLALTVSTEIIDITGGQGTIKNKKLAKPLRNRYEVDQFQYVSAPNKKSDDEECLILLLM